MTYLNEKNYFQSTVQLNNKYNHYVCQLSQQQALIQNKALQQTKYLLFKIDNNQSITSNEKLKLKQNVIKILCKCVNELNKKYCQYTKQLMDQKLQISNKLNQFYCCWFGRYAPHEFQFQSNQPETETIKCIRNKNSNLKKKRFRLKKTKKRRIIPTLLIDDNNISATNYQRFPGLDNLRKFMVELETNIKNGLYNKVDVEGGYTQKITPCNVILIDGKDDNKSLPVTNAVHVRKSKRKKIGIKEEVISNEIKQEIEDICQMLGIGKIKTKVKMYGGYKSHVAIYRLILTFVKADRNDEAQRKHLNAFTSNQLRDIQSKISSKGQVGKKSEMIDGIVCKLKELWRYYDSKKQSSVSSTTTRKRSRGDFNDTNDLLQTNAKKHRKLNNGQIKSIYDPDQQH